LKTLQFCTSYIENETAARERYIPYINYYKKVSPFLGVTKIVLIDDGSPEEFLSLLGIPIFDALEIPRELPHVCVVSFRNHLGRSSTHVYPGWWRSFSFSSVLAETYGFKKIVHIESDAYVLSSKMADVIKKEASSWCVFWSAGYAMPETSLQIICKTYIKLLSTIFLAGEIFYTTASIDAEHILEYTKVIKEMTGDRYGEAVTHGKEVVIPETADFCCQCADPEHMGVFEKSELLAGIAQ
jgi:hypothetical protein